MSPRAAAPARVSVRMFQMGFGDCFLLTFGYARKVDGRDERHVLIDFGSTHWPKGHKQRYKDVTDSIADRTGGRLDAIVMTHRHKDHLSGFGDERAGEALARMKPSIVLRPWTEDPDAAADATTPKLLGAKSRSFTDALAAGQEFAAHVAGRLEGARGLRGQLGFMAAEQVANPKAVKRLESLSAAAELGGRYLHAGQPSGLEQVLPGVEVSVLGPPTVDQWPDVAKQRADDPEFWANGRAVLDRLLDEVPAPDGDVDAAPAPAGAGIEPGPARWLVERMHSQHTHSLLRIARTLDDAMNNTSLVLLFKVGKRRLLFPGDAQIENWSYSLSKADVRKQLAEVDFSKVGHHGSRNATPRSLVDLWRGRPRGLELTSMMSTMGGVHGESEATLVPRDKLLIALRELGPLFETDLKGLEEELFVDAGGKASDRKPLALLG